MEIKVKLRSGLFLIIILVLLATGCESKKEGATPVRIAFFPNITHSQAMVMKEHKTLENMLGTSYQVSWISFQAGPEEVEALFAGEVDIGYIGPVPAINAYIKSEGDFKVIANACNAGALLVKGKDAKISKVSDLDGKTVAVPQLGNTQHICLLNLLADNGLAPKSSGGTVNVVAVENGDLQIALERKDVDAALVPEPWGSIVMDKCGAEVVLDYNDILLDGDYPTAVIIVNGDFYSKHKELVKSFLEAHKEATFFINENKEEAISIVNRQIEEITGKKCEDKIMNSAFDRLNITGDLSKDAMILFGKIMYDQEFISKEPDVDMMDTSLWQAINQ